MITKLLGVAVSAPLVLSLTATPAQAAESVADAGKARQYNVTAHGGVHGKVGDHRVSPDSIRSMALAHKRGFTCTETDWRQTRATATSPMRIVNMHDADVSHQTNAPRGTIVEETTWARLRTYRLDDGQRIPTAERYVRWASRHSHFCILTEIKDYTPVRVWTPGEFRYLQRLAARYGMADRLRLEIPRQVHLLMAKENAPRLRTVWKLKNEWPSNATFREMSIDAVIPRWGGVYRAHVVTAHRLGIKLYGGVSNNPERWQRIVDIGADGTNAGTSRAVPWFERRGTVL